MHRGTWILIPVGLYVAASIGGCAAIPYRLEWEWGKDGGASDPRAPRPARSVERTPQTAFIAWKTAHQDLGRALDRRGHGAPPPRSLFRRLDEALEHLRGVGPDTAEVIERARERYRLIELSPSPPLSWYRSQLRAVERILRELAPG